MFLPVNDRDLFDRSMNDFDQLSSTEKENLVSLLGTFEMYAVPTVSNITEVFIATARHLLLDKPAPLVEMMKRGIPSSQYECFWSTLTLPAIQLLFTQQLPTPAKVNNVIFAANEDAIRQDEQNCLYYLRQMVSGFDVDDLESFLRFISGSTVMPQKITVLFNKISGLARRPIAHTCSNTLELSTTYRSAQEMKREFKFILADPDCFKMDMI
jgi:hypothetical protein